jgi:hypothetical protein
MSKRFYLITNATNIPATFTNTANIQDTVPLLAKSMTHTGGKDGDYCLIPTCTSEANFTSNHMQVLAPELNIAFWIDDDRNPTIYYSLDGKFSSGVAVPASQLWDGASLLIDLNSLPPVKFFQF